VTGPRAAARRGAALDFLVAGVALALLAHWALGVDRWIDFYVEAGPSVTALLNGNLHGFLALAPPYGGSMLLRAPAFALGGLVHLGGRTAAGNGAAGLDGAYRLGALECMAAVAALALCVAGHQRARGRPAPERALLLVVLIVNPASAWAIKLGHPEEMLTAALAVAAVLLASRGRATWAGILLGVAVASKQWGVLAFPLCLAACPGRRVRFTVATAASAALILAPLFLAASAAFVRANQAVTAAPSIFRPQQLWWTLHLSHVTPVAGGGNDLLISRPDGVVAAYSHPLIAVLATIAGVVWWRRGRAVAPLDALLLFSGVMLLRCLLDPWDSIYYHLAFIFALATWEVYARRRAPMFALAASLLVWVDFETLPLYWSSDLVNLAYVAWALPGAVVMVARALALLPSGAATSHGGASPAVRAVRTSRPAQL